LYGDGRRLVFAINDVFMPATSPFRGATFRRTAFGKKYVRWVKDRLEVGVMARAAELVVGRHDLAAFSERDTKRDGQSTIVRVESAEITTDEHLIRFRITDSHFCGRW